MSELVKKHHIEIKVGSKKPRLYLVPKDKANGLEKLLKDYLVEETVISSDKVFRQLDKKFSKAGNNLTGLRLRDGLSQLQLAKKIGISRSMITSIEKGEYCIEKDIALKLAKVFKTNYKIFLNL